MAEAPNVGYYREADVCDKSSNDRFWLQAVGRRIANYVGFTPSYGHPRFQFPVLVKPSCIVRYA